MINIVLFGPPGAGKGTQSEKIRDQFNLVHLSTGDMLRIELEKETELGKQAKKFIDKGKLVPDEVVIGMIGKRLAAYPDAYGFIFDGFPRTRAQAEALDKLLDDNGTSITGMISLEVGEEELTSRLKNRGLTSGRSDDNDEGIISKRIEEYENKTRPVAEYYKERGKYYGINGIGEIDSIFKDIVDSISEMKQSHI